MTPSWTLAAALLAAAALSCTASTRPPSTPAHPSRPAAPAAPLPLELAAPATEGRSTPSPVLGILRAELSRAKQQLGKGTSDAPYFVEYEAFDTRSVRIRAEWGAVIDSSDTRRRMLNVDVRVGDPSLDNTHPLRAGDPFERLQSQFRTQATLLPLQDDPLAIRAAAWLATERTWRDAREQLIRVRSQRAVQAAEDDPSPDFSVERPVTWLDSPAAFDLDRGAWETRLSALSAGFARRPEVEHAVLEVSVIAETRFLITSEGTTLQLPTTHARLSFDASTTAQDGMGLHRYRAFDARLPGELPDDGIVQRAIAEELDRLLALRRAPVAEPFAGPVILEGRAAAVFFHEALGHRVEGHRQKDDDEGQTFARKLGERVLPDIIDIFDDPRATALYGAPLNGHYVYDDEGVASQRASIVEGGVFKGFLMSRAPTRGFFHSNGHARREAGNFIVARQGVLVVQPRQSVSTVALRKRFLDELRNQRKPYGLRFEDIEGGYTNTTTDGPQAFKVLPTIVWKVFEDGHEELVRGVDLEGTPLTVLASILAASDEYSVFDGYCGAESGSVPVSAISPALLLARMETARSEQSHERPPLLPPPPLSRGEGGAR